jgi:hypothetical protein
MLVKIRRNGKKKRDLPEAQEMDRDSLNFETSRPSLEHFFTCILSSIDTLQVQVARLQNVVTVTTGRPV